MGTWSIFCILHILTLLNLKQIPTIVNTEYPFNLNCIFNVLKLTVGIIFLNYLCQATTFIHTQFINLVQHCLTQRRGIV